MFNDSFQILKLNMILIFPTVRENSRFYENSRAHGGYARQKDCLTYGLFVYRLGRQIFIL